MKHPSSREARRALALLVAVWPCAARAEDAAMSEPIPIAAPAKDASAAAPGPAPLRVGAIAGIGFPRPFAVEALVSLFGVVDVGAEYGTMPTVDILGVETGLWSFAADLRLFPTRGAFFVGLLAGRQHIGTTTTLTLSGVGSLAEEAALDSWFLNPRIGFLWTTRSRYAFGIDAGVQIPVASAVASSLPLALYPEAQARADSLGGLVLPTLDLLRIGLIL